MKQKSVKTGFLIAVLHLALMSSVYASDAKNPNEFQFTGGFFLAKGGAATGTAQLQINYGYYLRPKWQVGVRLLASYELNDPIEDVWTASTSGYFSYYPFGDRPDQKWQPFAGALLGMGYSDVDNTGVAGPLVGLKYYLSETTYLVGEYQYEVYFAELKAGAETTDFNSSNHALTMGMGFRW